ncbi:alpha/beta fold hydrolase [Sorangium sp. So ce1036]|uniref:alpha/beta fold hydrolase n=1 Tax=Sorangium sp. So ce1036 TaxID=3133328 RepID=UPI003F0AA1BD
MAAPGALRHHDVEVEGARAHMLEAGAGAPIVLLASPLVCTRTYLPLVHLLARQARVIAVDLPGAGRSSRLAAPWTFERYGRWTRRFLDRLTLDSITLVGHSNSGAIALLAAAGAPGPIARLVLADTVGARRARSVPRVLLARGLDALLEPLLSLRAAPHFLGNLLRHPAAMLAHIRAGSLTQVLDRAPEVEVPTLLAWGRHDRTMPLDGAERLRRALPSAAVVVGPGRHDWMLTHRAAFARALLEFIA